VAGAAVTVAVTMGGSLRVPKSGQGKNNREQKWQKQQGMAEVGRRRERTESRGGRKTGG
jgi:hypothetical protein